MGRNKVSDGCLRTLEEVKEQYQQYAEVGKLYELPIFQQEVEKVGSVSPSLDNLLTDSKLLIKRH